MNPLERLRRFWLARAATDHPLTERERQETPPPTAVDETFRTIEGVFGDSAGDSHREGVE